MQTEANAIKNLETGEAGLKGNSQPACGRTGDGVASPCRVTPPGQSRHGLLRARRWDHLLCYRHMREEE